MPNLIRTLSLLVVASLSASTSWAADGAVERLSASAPRTTSVGHPFIAPEGFSLTTRDRATILVAPEGDSTIAIVDVDATDADDAVAKGWAAVRPGFARKLKLSTPRSARNGWTDQRYYEYETSPNEKASVTAVVRRSTVAPGTAWVAVVVDATESTMEKRARSSRRCSAACGLPAMSARASPDARPRRSTQRGSRR